MSIGERILGGIEKVVVYIAYLLVALMVINTSTGVFFRYILNNALSWTDELGRYMMIWVGFFGCYLAARDNSHVGVEMFVGLFKPGAQRVFHVVARVVVIVFLFIILSESGKQLGLLGIQTSPALEIPMAIPYSAVSVGVFLMLIENIAHLVRLFTKPSSAPTPAHTAADGK